MSDPRLPVTGGCLCGAIGYRSDAPPLRGAYCHCSICRRSYGGLFGVFLRFGPTLRFLQGAPASYRSSGFGERGFCADCGSGLTFRYDGNPDVWVTVGSLDHPEHWPLTPDADWGPSRHVETDSRVPWHLPADGLPQAPGDALAALKDAARRHR